MTWPVVSYAPGLHRPVVICRDHWGIPHLRAENEHDVFFAQGFVTAQDRLWHMDYDRQRALGRWAEWAGPAALSEDRLMRTFRLARAAQADLAVSSPAAQAMLASYTAGVNAFITITRTLPIEYTILDTTPEPWETWHCLAVYKVRNMLMGTYEMKLWRARLGVYECPQAHRTSNAVDRLLDDQDRLLDAMRSWHGTTDSARLRWDQPSRVAPFHDLNGLQYHPNWLHNLLIASSLGGLRH